MSIKVTRYRLPVYWARALINGDYTGLSDNGASNSMFWETFEKLDLDAGDATWLHQSCCCDHCVNHWGIGLCGCGSGQKVGKCECGSQKAHDILGVKYDSFGAILKNFG